MVNYEFIICHPVGEISLEKESSIQAFSEKYAVDQDLVVKYMHHLAYLEMMKRKRERERREKAEREQNLSYEDVEWEKLLCEDLLKKQRVSVLNLYIGHHNLTSEKKLSKKDKLNVVSAHIQLSAAQKQVKRVVRTMLCRNLGVIPPRMMKMTIYLLQNWHPTIAMTVTVTMSH